MTSSGVTVSFDGHGLRLDTSEDAEVICQAMMGKEVEILILQGNTFGIEAAERVGIELSNQPSLREAHFKDLFTSRGREEVPEALGHLLRGICDSAAELTLLDLSDNAIGPIGAPSVIEFLNTAIVDKIEKFYINNCGMGPEGSTSIAASIPKLKSLREFVCGRNRLENKGAASISRALSELNTLELLTLYQNGIGVDGIEKLVAALMANINTIQEIDLSDNTIKAEGSDALAKVLSGARNLKTIRLNDALLQNEGFSIICDALANSPSFDNLDHVSFEGNELHGQKIVDLIEITFQNCNQNFTLDLLENEFSRSELERLEVLTQKFNIIVDDLYSDVEETESDDGSRREEGELESDDDDDDYNDNDEDSRGGDSGDQHSNGYVDLSNIESDIREVAQDFIKAVSKQPHDADSINSAFIQLISTDSPNSREKNFEAIQILCEELGLMKMEQTCKKKPLEREAIVYIGKRLNELPQTFRDFFEIVVKDNADIGCGKLLFEKLEI